MLKINAAAPHGKTFYFTFLFLWHSLIDSDLLKNPIAVTGNGINMKAMEWSTIRCCYLSDFFDNGILYEW